jgi:hypothetical protein
MEGKTDREAKVRHLRREIVRCRRATDNISDKKTLERLSAYLRDLEGALEAHLSRDDPRGQGAAPPVSGAISPE